VTCRANLLQTPSLSVDFLHQCVRLAAPPCGPHEPALSAFATRCLPCASAARRFVTTRVAAYCVDAGEDLIVSSCCAKLLAGADVPILQFPSMNQKQVDAWHAEAKLPPVHKLSGE
jgi:hypothetical protein